MELFGAIRSNLEPGVKNIIVAISPFFYARGNKNIGATICIGQEILCLPYAGFFHGDEFDDDDEEDEELNGMKTIITG